MSSQTVGQFLMDFGSDDRHVAGSREAQFYAISVNSQHDDFDVLTDQNLLPAFRLRTSMDPPCNLPAVMSLISTLSRSTQRESGPV